MTGRVRLAPHALFAATLAAAGLPIYIHAPKFYLDRYDVPLVQLGGVLFLLRSLDVVQDPFLGWLSGRLGNWRRVSVAVAGAVMAAAMLGLFAVAPPIAPLVWFALTLALLFSAFSFLTITFYAQGVATARFLSGQGHVRLAGWRETGALVGISVAAMAPVALGAIAGRPYALFALGFAGLVVVAVAGMRAEWTPVRASWVSGPRAILRDRLSRRLLLVAVLNAAPVAVTSTLFLFFVEGRLDAAGWEGPLLMLFFLSAAAVAPVWSVLAQGIGARSALLLGMVLAIASFLGAAFLGAGDIWLFALICIASGAAIGADMTLLPAMFAARTAAISSEPAIGFGLWSFSSKISLAVAAVVLLPILQAAGYRSGETLPESALVMLTVLYAVVPLALKLAAMALLLATPIDGARSPELARV